ncbi:MAG: hypothetical protein AB8B69_07505 [Chitinophagales bacterium]
MELKLKIGVGELVFGMKENQCKEILGEPNREWFDEQDISEKLVEFNAHKICLTFYGQEENRMGYLRTSNPNLRFNGMSIIDQKIEVVINEVFKDIISDWEVENYNSWFAYFNEENWLNLSVEFGAVVKIELGVSLANNEDYDWPLIEKNG